MSLHEAIAPEPQLPPASGILKLAVLAVGGQGGGVLTGWIEDLGRQNGYAVQATSVAGVAQRTGATVYYIEMAPASGRLPVFALMPAAGDVDVLIAAEWMEAGRAIIRGFVTPDRTTLIASTHRALAVSEKMVPGSGIADAAEVMAGAEIAARRLVIADFDKIARQEGSVISASLFGALAASGTLPFPRAAFEAAVWSGGKGVEGSLRAFRAGYEAALGKARTMPAPAPSGARQVRGPARLLADWRALEARIDGLPEPSRQMARTGLQKVVGFQDLDYGGLYLDRLNQIAAIDCAPFTLSREASKYLANAMAYDDIIAVADTKTRAGRRERIADEMGADGDQLMQVTEFLHPRAEEIVSMLPAEMGARWAANPRRMALLGRLFSKPRRLRSDGLGSFLLLYLMAGLRSWRPRTYRHAQEMRWIEDWLGRAIQLAQRDYDLGVEVLRCRRLVKGYSDTHTRGLSKYDRVMGGVAALTGRQDAADWARRLREAALKDEEGKALNGALATIRSFLP